MWLWGGGVKGVRESQGRRAGAGDFCRVELPLREKGGCHANQS